jgi:hypothetical protein
MHMPLSASCILKPRPCPHSLLCRSRHPRLGRQNTRMVAHPIAPACNDPESSRDWFLHVHRHQLQCCVMDLVRDSEYNTHQRVQQKHNSCIGLLMTIQQHTLNKCADAWACWLELLTGTTLHDLADGSFCDPAPCCRSCWQLSCAARPRAEKQKRLCSVLW